MLYIIYYSWYHTNRILNEFSILIENFDMKVEHPTCWIITNGYIWLLHQNVNIWFDNRFSGLCTTTWRIGLPADIFDFIPEWSPS